MYIKQISIEPFFFFGLFSLASAFSGIFDFFWGAPSLNFENGIFLKSMSGNGVFESKCGSFFEIRNCPMVCIAKGITSGNKETVWTRCKMIKKSHGVMSHWKKRDILLSGLMLRHCFLTVSSPVFCFFMQSLSHCQMLSQRALRCNFEKLLICANSFSASVLLGENERSRTS